MSDPLRLTGNDLEVVLRPDIGGSIAAFRFMGQDVLRPAPDDADDALDMACFPLVPFSNRIANGHLNWKGQIIRLPPNMGDHPHAIHGHGWQVPWTVLRNRPDHAHLQFIHPAGDWPWSYEAHQVFSLTEDSLVVHLRLRNTSSTIMPAGLGLHPYFPRTAATRLTASLTGVWDTAEDGLPLDHTSLPQTEGFDDGRAIDDLSLDHVFTGWNGIARIAWPEYGLHLIMEADPPLDRLVIYIPDKSDFFCVEPVSHHTDAFNHMANETSDTGTISLEPGGEISAMVRFSPFAQ